MSPPVKPQPSLEFMLAQQANDAIRQGADPHDATDMLGTMLKHLRANPSVAQQGNDALAQGADPHAVAGTVWQLAQAASAPKPGILSRAGAVIKGGFTQMAEHPIDTAESLVTTPVRSLITTLSPGVGEARPDARLSKGGNSSGRAIDTTPYDAEHGGVTPAQRTAAGLQTVANVAFPAIASQVSAVASPLVGKTLARMAGTAAGGAAAGAAYNPNDPAVGAIAGGLTAPVVGEASARVAGPVLRTAGTGVSKGVTALGMRPSGLTAEEMARDAAAMNAPAGPQAGAAASNTPVTVANAGNTPGQPTTGQQVRAVLGSAAEKAGIESSKTRALREVARRFDLDNVTEPDATTYVSQNPGKPLAVLNLGSGNVAGLARTAKDVPSLARRQIPEFLHQQTSGTPNTPTEGATLQRVTGDIENRIGLAPENYYKNVDKMIAEQKALSKPDYDKVRDLPVDDPEVLSLFDIPEFQFAHDAVAKAERIRPNGAKILPLSSTSEVGGQTVKTQNPQTLGTIDKMRQYVGAVARGKLDSSAIDRNTAGAMLERLDAATDRMDELYPDYAKAREGYAGRAQMKDAYEAGKDEFMRLDPREIQQKLATMPESQADLYRRGGYDALRANKLTKMDDGANIGAFLEKNSDIRDRVAALAKDPSSVPALRGDFGVEREIGNRKNFILGGPNTAERLIEHESTQPRVTQLGNLVRKVPGVGGMTAALIDNTMTRRLAEQTGDVMGEVGKIMTRTGTAGVRQTFDEIAAIRARDLQREAIRQEFARSTGAMATSRLTNRQRGDAP